MQTHRYARILFVFMLLAAVFLGTSLTFAQAPTQANAAPRLIASNVVGRPITAGSHVFWQVQTATGQVAIYQYDLTQRRAFLITDTGGDKHALVSDGQMVAWIDRAPVLGQQVQGYDMTRNQILTIIGPSQAQGIESIAIDNGVLYYSDTMLGHTGIYARDLSNGTEKLLNSRGINVVTANRVLLWSEETAKGKYIPSDWSLYALKLDGNRNATKLVTRSGPLSGYAVSGDFIVWAFYPPADDTRVFLHRLSTGISTAISSDSAQSPRVVSNTVVWTRAIRGAVDQGTKWAVQTYDTNTASSGTMVTDSTAQTEARPVPGTNAFILAIAHSPAKGTRDLYLNDAQANGLRFTLPIETATVSSAAVTANTTPLSCGQVYRSSNLLYDCDGRFKMNGVQFFLPQLGINNKTFYDSNYNGSLPDIDYWLGIAQTQVLAKTIRIFVEWPTSGGTIKTSASTIYDFATRANTKGMRLGLNMNNSSDFNLTTTRQNWIKGVVQYFKDRNALSLIAYVNADNEINNYCSMDCFDNNQSYVNSAVAYVDSFRNVVQSVSSGVLVTAGMSTEKAGSDTLPAHYNFFKRSSATNKALIDVTDFVSPHNYGGGAYGIMNDIRQWGYAGPVVLEEYGYPTDPVNKNSWWTEGNTACRSDPGFPTSSPNYNLCKNTAPYFVEINARAMRDLRDSTVPYVGGVAWMLADVNSKSCSSSPFDLYTGLYSAGSGYCGGTYSIPAPKDKATQFRVKTHHFYY